MAFLWKLTGPEQRIFDVSIVLPKHFVGMLLHDGQNVPDIEVRPEASALIYTMVEMARANGVNVYQYLTYLLEKCPTSQTSDEELDKLAPWDPEVKRITGERSEALQAE